jgi:hypothetical protein
MEANMSLDEVKTGIQKLNDFESNLSKKRIKKSHPELMRNALYYFPNWESAINQSIS